MLQGQQSVNPYQVYYTETQRDPEGIGDDYIPYNKPYGVMSWLENVQPAGDYFLIVDPDMTFHRSATDAYRSQAAVSNIHHAGLSS